MAVCREWVQILKWGSWSSINLQGRPQTTFNQLKTNFSHFPQFLTHFNIFHIFRVRRLSAPRHFPPFVKGAPTCDNRDFIKKKRNSFVSVVLVPNQNEGNRKVRVSTPPSPPRHLINQCTQNLWRGMFLKRKKENNQSFSIKSRNLCFVQQSKDLFQTI